ncbi:fibroblast growth factor 1 isoform X1 [Poecile atricapillus]|uniref:fibroblast growth factor 1 isoform X1 n=1 Tax=Poecile atricapillus TaxID=48891 RepID=UPI002738AD7B|nr:fibroblast growth factor 1 isoform X1 [Poecile atricapillus]
MARAGTPSPPPGPLGDGCNEGAHRLPGGTEADEGEEGRFRSGFWGVFPSPAARGAQPQPPGPGSAGRCPAPLCGWMRSASPFLPPHPPAAPPPRGSSSSSSSPSSPSSSSSSSSSSSPSSSSSSSSPSSPSSSSSSSSPLAPFHRLGSRSRERRSAPPHEQQPGRCWSRVSTEGRRGLPEGDQDRATEHGLGSGWGWRAHTGHGATAEPDHAWIDSTEGTSGAGVCL